MGPMLLAAAIVAGSTLASVGLDVGLNTLQNWAGALYADAFWSGSQTASPELLRLAREEREIDERLQGSDFRIDTTAFEAEGALTDRRRVAGTLEAHPLRER